MLFTYFELFKRINGSFRIPFVKLFRGLFGNFTYVLIVVGFVLPGIVRVLFGKLDRGLGSQLSVPAYAVDKRFAVCNFVQELEPPCLTGKKILQ